MKAKINLEMTEIEFTNLISIIDIVSSIGVDDESFKAVKKVDLMLKKNGYKRKYN